MRDKIRMVCHMQKLCGVTGFYDITVKIGINHSLINLFYFICIYEKKCPFQLLFNFYDGYLLPNFIFSNYCQFEILTT